MALTREFSACEIRYSSCGRCRALAGFASAVPMTFSSMQAKQLRDEEMPGKSRAK
jgi:hypothetical protein